MTHLLQSLLPKAAPLRQGVTWEHVLTAVTWISQGLQEKYIPLMPDVLDDNFERACEPLLRELDLYFSIVKMGTDKVVLDK